MACSGGALGSRLAPWSPPPFVCLCGHFAWHAWHFATWIVTLRGARGTYGTGLAPGARLCLVWLPPFAWQAWHLVTSSFTLRGRRGTSRHGSSLCVAGVALMALDWLRWRAWVLFGDIDCHFAWQAWHFATWMDTLRGRRGTWRHRPSLCVAGVELCDMDRHFAWQAWHLWHWAGSGGALGSRLAPWSPPLFAWQAWHLATSTVTLRGRSGTSGHGSSLCVAGVALMALGWSTNNLSPHNLSTHNLLTHTTCPHTNCPHNLRLSCHCLILFCLGNSYTYTRTHTHAHMTHAFRWSHNAHIHTCIHIHTHFHVRLYHTHTYTILLRTIAYTPFTHLPSTYICCTRRSFTISLIFPAFPIPTKRFFCCLLEEVDMWGSPALSFNCFCVCFCFGFLLLVVAV